MQVAAAISMHLGSANKQRLISKAILGVNLETEVTPFSFAVQSGSEEELRGATHAFTPDVTAKIYQILHENERYMNYHDNNAKLYIFISSRAGRLSWHGGAIPSWIKVMVVVHSKLLSRSLILPIQLQCTVSVFSHVLKQKIVPLTCTLILL